MCIYTPTIRAVDKWEGHVYTSQAVGGLVLATIRPTPAQADVFPRLPMYVCGTLFFGCRRKIVQQLFTPLSLSSINRMCYTVIGLCIYLHNRKGSCCGRDDNKVTSVTIFVDALYFYCADKGSGRRRPLSQIPYSIDAVLVSLLKK